MTSLIIVMIFWSNSFFFTNTSTRNSQFLSSASTGSSPSQSPSKTSWGMFSKSVLFTDSGKHLNGDARSKKHSVSDSIHSKTRFSDTMEDEEGRLVDFLLFMTISSILQLLKKCASFPFSSQIFCTINTLITLVHFNLPTIYMLKDLLNYFDS